MARTIRVLCINNTNHNIFLPVLCFMFCRKAEIADEVSEAEADNVLLGRFSCKSIFREIDIV